MNKFNAYFTYIIILLVFSGIITVGLYLSLMLLPIIILGALALGAISWFLNYKAAKQTKIVPLKIKILSLKYHPKNTSEQGYEDS